MKMAEQNNIRTDVELIKELKDMRNSNLQSLNAVVWFLKKEYDKTRTD